MLSRQTYIALAILIKSNSTNDNKSINKDKFVEELADYLKQDNPSFKRHRFIEACN